MKILSPKTTSRFIIRLFLLFLTSVCTLNAIGQTDPDFFYPILPGTGQTRRILCAAALEAIGMKRGIDTTKPLIRTSGAWPYAKWKINECGCYRGCNPTKTT